VFSLDKFGNEVWQKTLGGGSDDKVSSIIKKDLNSYLICGYTESYAEEENRDLYVVTIDDEGKTISEKMIGSIDAETGISVQPINKGNNFIICANVNKSRLESYIGLFKINKKLEYSNIQIPIHLDP
jgi:hypothetical protein